MIRFFTALALGAAIFAATPAMAEGETELFAAEAVKVSDVTPVVSEKDGVLEINNNWPTTIQLAKFDVKDKKIDQSVVRFTADVQAVNFTGKAFLEMWLHFPGKGFFFARGLDDALTADSGWRNLSAAFVLKKDEQPDDIVLNLRFGGAGTIRVKNLKVVSDTGAPPPAAASQETEKPVEKPEEKDGE